MTLNEENKNATVNHRLQRAKETLEEVKGNIQMGYWRVAANRLYYACYYSEENIILLLEPAEKFIA